MASSWKKATDPLAPTPPIVHHPGRCMNCGHLGEPDGDRNESHDDEVGCLVPGGTKYIEHADGTALRACACEKFVPCLILSTLTRTAA